MRKLYLIFVILAAYQALGDHIPGLAIKLNDQGLGNVNELLTPIIMSRYTNKNYPNINLQANGADYSLKVTSIVNMILNPLSAFFDAKVTRTPQDGLALVMKSIEGFATFTASITIKGKVYTGEAKVIYDKTSIGMFTYFDQKGIRESIEIFMRNVAVDKTHIAVIYKDPGLNSTLNEFKELLQRAYAHATQEFIYHLIAELNEKNFHNLVLGYTGECGFNTTMVSLPIYDHSNNEIIFLLNGGIIDLHSMSAITTKYPSQFPIDDIKKVTKTRVFLADKVLESMLVGCKGTKVSYEGRQKTIRETLTRIPEILKKYSEKDTFFPDVSMATPWNMKMQKSIIHHTDSSFLFELKVKQGQEKHTIFTVEVIVDFSSHMDYHKELVAFDISGINVKDVKLVKSTIDLNINTLKAAFPFIMTAFAGEFNEQKSVVSFKKEGLPSYYSRYFEVSDMNLLNEYLEIKFDPPK